MNQKKNILRQAKEEILQLENCPMCGEKLNHKWLSRQEQEELELEPDSSSGSIGTNSIDYKPISWWTQIYGGFHLKCLKKGKTVFCPKILFKDYEHEDIPYQEEQQKYQKERELVEKIATALLPEQNLKIRFVQSYGAESMEAYGLVMKFEHPLKKEVDNLCVCFPIELLARKEKTNPGFFCEAVAHELTHACQEVSQNPQHSDNVFSCSCQKLLPNSSTPSSYTHEGPGHDKIWHNKFDEFRERIKNEKLITAGSEYSSLGKEFILRDNGNDIVLSPNGKRLRVNNKINDISPEKLSNWKKILRKWMEKKDIEKITLDKRNHVLCEKYKSDGTISFGGEPPGGWDSNLFPYDEIPDGLKVKIDGVDIDLFFRKIGKKSITRQELDEELGIINSSESEKVETKNKNNKTAWIIFAILGIMLLLSLIYWLWKRKTKKTKK